MNSNISFFLVSIFLLIIFLSPLYTNAADEFHLITCATKYNFIGPAPDQGLAPMTPFCNICDLFKLLQSSFTFIWLYLSIPLGAVMMLYGGFLMLLPSFGGQSSSQVTKGKKILTNAFIGLVIVFLAWIGVDSILKLLGARYGPDGGIPQLGPWNKIKCTAPTVSVPIRLPTQPRPGPGPGPEQPPSSAILTEKAARDFLTANGCTVNNNPCPTGSNGQGCTTLSGMRQATLDAGIATMRACDRSLGSGRCSCIITGGLEPGHSETGTCRHNNGCKVDIDMTTQLRSFISRTYPRDTPFIRPDDLAECYVSPDRRSQWCDEGDHFDISAR